MALTDTESIYLLLTQIADAPKNRDLKFELNRTATGTVKAATGAGTGGVMGATAGALLLGPLGAAIGGGLGAFVGAKVAVGNGDFKSVPEILRGASARDKQRLVEAAKTVALQLSIQLAASLVLPAAAGEARSLLVGVMEQLGYLPKKSEE